MKLLALDTATEVCSVAVLLQADGGAPQLLVRELPPGPGHSAHVLPMIQSVLAEASLRLADLDGIAFGRGPGGFTGVRLATSVTQGLAFGAGLPVVAVSDLLAVAQQALDAVPEAASVLVCNDARMQEVYWGCATRDAAGLAIAVGAERVGVPESVTVPEELTVPLVGAGRGFTVWPALQQRLAAVLSEVQAELLPRAREIARLAVPLLASGRGVAPELAQPVYLRDDVAKPSRK